MGLSRSDNMLASTPPLWHRKWHTVLKIRVHGSILFYHAQNSREVRTSNLIEIEKTVSAHVEMGLLAFKNKLFRGYLECEYFYNTIPHELVWQ